MAASAQLSDVNGIPVGTPTNPIYVTYPGDGADMNITGIALAAAVVAPYTPETLASSTRSTHYAPLAGRKGYMQLTGTGSATVTIVYSLDTTNYYPEATGTDGGAPIIVNSIAYNGGTQNGVIVEFENDKNGILVAALPGTVTGTVTVGFYQ